MVRFKSIKIQNVRPNHVTRTPTNGSAVFLSRDSDGNTFFLYIPFKFSNRMVSQMYTNSLPSLYRNYLRKFTDMYLNKYFNFSIC